MGEEKTTGKRRMGIGGMITITIWIWIIYAVIRDIKLLI